MTSPDMSRTENAGYGTGSHSGHAGGASTENTSNDGRTDDVSFARNLGVDQVADGVKAAAQGGMSNVEDAMGQLQEKASQLTSNLIDRVNVDELTQKLEEQVRDHPARTLLAAAGAGFLLGRLVRK